MVGKIAPSLIKGIQKNEVASCVKHYALNNQELARTTVDVEVSKRALFETYLAGFEAAVKTGGVYSVMGAYNKFEGQHCCHHKYLVNDILKGKWGFDGAYITDWGGCRDTEEAVFNGLDIEMGTSEDYDKFYFAGDFEKMAEESEEVRRELDEKVRRILRLMIRINKLDKNRYEGEYNTKRHQQITYNIASEAMVLLKNEDDALPLKKDAKKILLIGENAAAKHALGGNSSYVRALYEVSLLEGMQNRGEDREITCISTIQSGEKPIKPELTDIVDPESGVRGFRREAYDNLYCYGESCETKYFNKPYLSGEPRNEYTYRYFGKINIPEDDEYKLVVSGRRGVRVTIDGKMRIIFDADETVKKSYSKFYKKGDKIDIMLEVQPQTPNPVLDLGWIRKSEESSEGVDRILEQAKTADKVIFCGGLNHDYDTEGLDRNDMKLPAEQNELIEKLLEVRPDMIIVMTAGAPVEMPWIDKAKAVLWTWYAGMEGGNAFADIIYGNISPSGHLPVTFPYKYEDTPVARYGEYDAVKERYFDDIYVGYKGYEKDGIKAMFPFGYGKTYSEFEYSSFVCKDGEASICVKNTGGMKAKALVQMYIGKEKQGVEFPVKELKDFEKAELEPGEEKTLSFKIGYEELKYYDEEIGDFSGDIDGYTVYLAEDAEKIIAKETLRIK